MKDALGSVQSVLLLGGTSDIGLASARALVRAGAREVTLAARDTDAAQAAAAQLSPAQVRVVDFDAADDGRRAAGIEAGFAGAGDVDLVIVAFGLLGRAGDEQLADAGALHDVNGRAAVAAMADAAERLRAQGHGTLVLLSSVAADRPRVSNYAYGSSKAAADAFARGLGDRLHGSGVEILILRPGFVRSAMTAGMDAAPFAVDPDAVAGALVEAVRRGAPVTYVPGILRWVMLVLRLIPRPIFRRLPI
ncbi:MAG: decaprenylphospho-beta-D-erythro-pentofuranosid-2-ulose 2-reductase [Solirubrobacteraceae bacterium]|jgi:decaprenylphospho-beta-D-erythro-pentofuranosid-2-ulose 2-reductase|nr:decaprenylphospho-beta-D-erythro-pentofuranosid-2-ulose 2-reductase [Solirubrobacteraceae bacterium]